MMINNIGRNGSPYLTLLDDLKNPCDCPFNKIKYQLLYTNIKTISMIILLKQKILSTFVMNNQETRSYDFMKSNLIATFPKFVLLVKSLTTSWPNSTFFTMLLPFTNLAWLLEINIGGTLISLPCRTLEIICCWNYLDWLV